MRWDTICLEQSLCASGSSTLGENWCRLGGLKSDTCELNAQNAMRDDMSPCRIKIISLANGPWNVGKSINKPSHKVSLKTPWVHHRDVVLVITL